MARFIHSRKKVKGEAPGALVFLGHEKMLQSRVRLIRYDIDSVKEEELKTIKDIESQIKPQNVCWINIDGLQDIELIDQIGKDFGISALTLEKLLNTDQRPKFIEEENCIVCIVKASSFSNDLKSINTEQISFVLGENYLLTFQERVGDHFEPVRHRIRNKYGKIRTASVDYLLYALLDALIDNYMIHIEELGQNIEALENKLNSDDKTIIETIYHYKTEIVFLRKALRPLRELMTRILKSDSPLLKERTYIYFQELDDLVVHANEALELYYTMVSDQLSIFHTNVSNRVNDVMKILTIFSAIFIPLTFIAGIYGTNFDVVPELHYQYSYFIMWGVMVVVSGVMLSYFRRKKWL